MSLIALLLRVSWWSLGTPLKALVSSHRSMLWSRLQWTHQSQDFNTNFHRLIIPRWAKCFVLRGSWTFCCPVLGPRLVLYLPTSDTACRPIASLHHCTAQSAYPYMVNANCTVRRKREGSTLTEDVPFSYLGMINLWMYTVVGTEFVYNSFLYKECQ